jgi:hypothetical protein
MSKKNIILIWLTMFLFILAVPAYSGTLDGKTFVGQSGKTGKKSSAEEKLSFQNGKLYSVGCAKYGFGESDYTTKVEGDSIHFKSNMVNPNNGEIAWEGTVQGDKIEATFVWTKKRWYWKDAHQVKWLKGSLQN